MATQKAYDRLTGQEITPGTVILDFRGDECIFERVSRDKSPGRDAKILTEGMWALYASCFPGVEVR